jgi:hypothetical protein
MEKPVIRSFGMEKAKKAQLLGKDSWKKYPERMCQMRARAWALRDGFADVLKGIRSEADIDTDEPLNDLKPAEGITVETLTKEPETIGTDIYEKTIDAENLTDQVKNLNTDSTGDDKHVSGEVVEGYEPPADVYTVEMMREDLGKAEGSEELIQAMGAMGFSNIPAGDKSLEELWLVYQKIKKGE